MGGVTHPLAWQNMPHKVGADLPRGKIPTVPAKCPGRPHLTLTMGGVTHPFAWQNMPYKFGLPCQGELRFIDAMLRGIDPLSGKPLVAEPKYPAPSLEPKFPGRAGSTKRKISESARKAKRKTARKSRRRNRR